MRARVALLACWLAVAAQEAAATMFPKGQYDSCIAARNANFTAAYGPGATAFTTMYNLQDRTQCAGRVPHPVDPAFEALGWVNCTSASAVKLRFNAMRGGTPGSVTLSGVSTTLLRFTVTEVRGGPVAPAAGYSMGNFLLSYKGSGVGFQSATIYPTVQGVDCPLGTLATLSGTAVQACSTACSQFPSHCAGFTVLWTNNVPTCRLKDSLASCGAPLPAGTIGGFYYAGYAPIGNAGNACDGLYQQFTSPQVASQADCASLCSAAVSCTGYMYYAPTTCNLLTSSPGNTHELPVPVNGNCYRRATALDLSSRLWTTGMSIDNFYNAPIDFGFTQTVQIDAFSFVTPTASPSAMDPVAFELSYSTDNGFSWTSLVLESNANNVPTARGVIAGPFYVHGAALSVPAPLPPQVFPSGRTGHVVNLPARAAPLAYRYYHFTPLAARGSNCQGPSCNCNSVDGYFCVSLSEIEFFLNGAKQWPAAASILAPNSPAHVSVYLASGQPLAGAAGSLLIDGSTATEVILALPSLAQFVHATPSLVAAYGSTFTQSGTGLQLKAGGKFIVDFGAPVAVDAFRFAAGHLDDHFPVTWTLSGSNDPGVAGTTLHAELTEVVTGATPFTAGFVGCFNECNTQGCARSLPVQLGGGNIPGLTLVLCQQLAHQAGYSIFGMFAGSQCWGGTSYTLAVSRGASASCSSTCSSGTGSCGGPAAVIVYTLNSYVYLGCYADNQVNDVNARLMTYLQGSGQMTLQVCAQLAVKAGYWYFAVQDGFQCFASNDLPTTVSKGSSTSQCTVACTGLPSATGSCGGFFYNSLYTTSLVPVGCFNQAGGAFSSFGSSYDIGSCVALTRAQGYPYFALTPTSCLGASSFQAATGGGSNGGGCSVACPNAPWQVCGGTGFVSVYADESFAAPMFPAPGATTPVTAGMTYPMPYLSHNPAMRYPGAAAFTETKALGLAPASPTYDVPWFSLELQSGELVVAGFYRGFSAVNACARCGACAAASAASGTDGKVVFGLVNASMLTASVYGPPGGPSTATQAPSSGTVTCTLGAVAQIVQVCADGVDVTAAVSPQVFLGNANVAKSVTFPLPSGASRFTVVAAGPDVAGSNAASAALAVVCVASLVPASAWNFATSLANSGWQTMASRNSAVYDFADDVCALRPAGMQSNNVAASTYQWEPPGYAVIPGAAAIWTAQPTTKHVAFSLAVASALSAAPTASPAVLPSAQSVSCVIATNNAAVTQVCVNGIDYSQSHAGSQYTFPYPGAGAAVTLTIVLAESQSAPQGGSFQVNCNAPWSVGPASEWRAVLSASASASAFPPDLCSAAGPSGQLADVVSVASGRLWTPATITHYTAFVTVLPADAAAPTPAAMDADQVYFSRLVRPVGALDTTSTFVSDTPTMAPSNMNLSAYRVLWYMGEDPAYSNGGTLSRSVASGRCPAGTAFSLAASVNRYVEFAQAASSSSAIATFMHTGTDFSQATAVMQLSPAMPSRFFGDYACGCDTQYPLSVVTSGASAGNAFCPGANECAPADPLNQPYGVVANTCGGTGLGVNYTECVDNGLVYGYTCECVNGASYAVNSVRELRATSDVDTTTGAELNSCAPLNIAVSSSNLGLKLQQNVSFTTQLSLVYFDSAKSVAKDAVDASNSAANWGLVNVTGAQLLTYSPCIIFAAQGASTYTACLVRYLTGIIFQATFQNPADNTTNGRFYQAQFTMPCGCQTMWLSVSTADPRPDDGRPKTFFAVQTFGSVLFSWVDDSYCATKFKFTRSVFDPAAHAFGTYYGFAPNYEASGGSSGVGKCVGDDGDTHTPAGQSLSDRLLDFPDQNPPGTLLDYCITATADETPNKPRYTSAQVCTNLTVNFEARFRVYVGLKSGAPDPDVTVTYVVYSPASTQTDLIELYRESNTTLQDGRIQVKLNMSTADFPAITGAQQLQVGFFFAKTEYFADTDTTVAHTFLCNGGRSQCNPNYPSLLVVPQLSFDQITIAVQDNTYSLLSGTVGIQSLATPQNALGLCPLIDVNLCFAEFPGGSRDEQFGCALTDASGFYSIELPIGANVVVTSVAFSKAALPASAERAHTFQLAPGVAPGPWRVGPQPLAGVHFVDTTTELVLVDIAGGSCNISVAAAAQLVLTRQRAFCQAPTLTLGAGEFATTGWAFSLLPVDALDPYSMMAGRGVRFYAQVPAAAFEVSAFVSATTNGNVLTAAASALAVSGSLLNTPVQLRPVVDLSFLPQLSAGAYADNATSAVTRAPTAATVTTLTTPTASPFAWTTLDATAARRVNTTLAFEADRLVRLQVDGDVSLSLIFLDSAATSKVQLNTVPATCLNGLFPTQATTTSYLSEPKANTLVARVSAAMSFFGNASLTCGYLPDLNITLVNLLGDADVSPNASYSVCNSTEQPCSFAMQHDVGANGSLSNAHVDLELSAVPTNVAPFAKPFSYGWASASVSSPLTTLWLFVLGQVPGSGGNSSLAKVDVEPLMVIWHPPGDLSYAEYSSVTTVALVMSTKMQTYQKKTTTSSVELGADERASLGVQEGVDALGAIVEASEMQNSEVKDTIDVKTGKALRTTALYQTRNEWAHEYTWSARTRPEDAALTKAGAQLYWGSNADVFVVLTQFFDQRLTDFVLASDSPCRAQLNQKQTLDFDTRRSGLGVYSRGSIVDVWLPKLYAASSVAVTEDLSFYNYASAYAINELRTMIEGWEKILTIKPVEGSDPSFMVREYASRMGYQTEYNIMQEYIALSNLIWGPEGYTSALLAIVSLLSNLHVPTSLSQAANDFQAIEKLAENIVDFFGHEIANQFSLQALVDLFREIVNEVSGKATLDDLLSFNVNSKHLLVSVAGGGALYRLRVDDWKSGANFRGSSILTSTYSKAQVKNEEVAVAMNKEVSKFRLGQVQRTEAAKRGRTQTNLQPLFVLGDSNPGDFFNVFVSRDLVYGSFTFTIDSGASTCPHEAGTLAREAPKLTVVSAQAANVMPGMPATFSIEAANAAETDPLDAQSVNLSPTNSTFLLFADVKQLADGARVVVNGLTLGSEPLTFHGIVQGEPFFLNVQVFAGAAPAYAIPLTLCTRCGNGECSVNQANSVVLHASFVQPCPGIQLSGELAQQPVVLTNPSNAAVALVFNNLDARAHPWAAQGNVQSVTVEFTFAGSALWTPLRDEVGVPINLVASEAAQSAVTQWDVGALGLTQTTLLVRGVVQCAVPQGMSAFDPRFRAVSATGTIVVDFAAPFVVGFAPRAAAYLGDVFTLTLSEAVDCQAAAFGVVMTTSLAYPAVPVTGISTAAGNLVVSCAGSAIKVQLAPGTVSFLALSGQNVFLVFTSLRDLAGNAAHSNIAATSPNYLYQRDGNVEVALVFAPRDPATARFQLTALELIGIADPQRGQYTPGSVAWQRVAADVASALEQATGVAAERVDVQYFWFTPGFAPLCVVNAIVNPGVPPVANEDVVSAFASAFPALFNSNGAQSMDLVPQSGVDLLVQRGAATDASLRELRAQLAGVQAEVRALLAALVPSYTDSPSASRAPVTSHSPVPAPTRRPTPPSGAPSQRPSKRPTSARPSALPSRSPSYRPSSAPSRPTAMPSAAPASQSPSLAPSHRPTFAPTFAGQTYYPTASPSRDPTRAPSQARPSKAPSKSPISYPSHSPIRQPSAAPATKAPSASPQAAFPSAAPSRTPVVAAPSATPTARPSLEPSAAPASARPSRAPTSARPSKAPSRSPVPEPSAAPSESPTQSPSVAPSWRPTTSANPTALPTVSHSPTQRPVTLKPLTTANPSTGKPTTHQPSTTGRPSFKPTFRPLLFGRR